MTAETTTTTTHDGMTLFRDACKMFRDVTRAPSSDEKSLYGGSLYGTTGDQIKFMFRHPLRAYADFAKIAASLGGDLNALDVRYPAEKLLLYLEQHTTSQLEALKSISAVNLRTHKDRLKDNPIFKISIPIGAMFGLGKLVSEWGPESDFTQEISGILTAIFNSEIAGGLFVGLTVGLVVMVFQIFFLIAPGIARAQLFDDLVQIALVSKKMEAPAEGGGVGAS